MRCFQVRGKSFYFLFQLPELLACIAGLPGKDGVLVYQFLDPDGLGKGVRTLDLVPE